jgi:hypothetical protein
VKRSTVPFCIRVPAVLAEALDRRAKSLGVTKSHLVLAALWFQVDAGKLKIPGPDPRMPHVLPWDMDLDTSQKRRKGAKVRPEAKRQAP